jgi:hypothetical protein
MIVKVKRETENPQIFSVDQPAKYNNGHHELYCRFNKFSPEIGKSYSVKPTHQWADINYKESVIVHCIALEERTIDDIGSLRN